MAQGVLPFKYELEESKSGMTALGGLPVYVDMVHKIGLKESITKHLCVRKDTQGWTDSEVVTSLIMLNLCRWWVCGRLKNIGGG